ncbi:capsular polysaccharide export protein, LipB/KpsS family [Acinetobacter indicus]|uniref:capsular polysaccharide export protein, LipB/KpsS family n=1 Tax=Acinetobacter indicus TaxID=756892 RepID=UPI001443DEAA|nr:capsular biosynthesis protein [Acinetobacter indicus]
MNVLILINAAPGYKEYYYQLGEELRLKGCNIYYAVDSMRSRYLTPLPDLDDSEKTHYFDKYFKENYLRDEFESFSDEYWGDVFYSDFDRFLTHNYNLDKTSEYWICLKNCLSGFFEEIFNNYNIDCVLYENISNSFAYMAYKSCVKHDKLYVGLMGSRLPGHFEIQNSIIDKELDKLSLLKKEPISGEEIEWFTAYKNKINSIEPDYMKNNGLDNVSLSRLLKFEKIYQLYKLAIIGFKYNSYYDFQFGSPWKAIFRGLKVNFFRYYRTKLSNKYYLDNEVVKEKSSKERFYVYPIHYHPESSTSVLAPEYTNEYTNIINIANNLPFGTYLYVKDHKSAKGVQDLSFYKKISVLPAVRLVNYDYNIKELIGRSQGVITVNSTAGYEALLLGKPVYLLGRVFYENFANVKKLTNFKSLRTELLSFDVTHDDVMYDFLSYYRYCYKGIIDIKGMRGVENIANQVFSHIKKMVG